MQRGVGHSMYTQHKPWPYDIFILDFWPLKCSRSFYCFMAVKFLLSCYSDQGSSFNILDKMVNQRCFGFPQTCPRTSTWVERQHLTSTPTRKKAPLDLVSPPQCSLWWCQHGCHSTSPSFFTLHLFFFSGWQITNRTAMNIRCMSSGEYVSVFPLGM